VDRLHAVHIGIDIGQKHDPTAVVVVQVLERPSGRLRPLEERWANNVSNSSPDAYEPETYFETRHMERMPLGTDYPAVAARVADILCSPLLLPYSRTVFVDVTGVGRPVFEIITKAVRAHEQGRNAWLRPITFTHGDRYDRGTGHLGKAYMVSKLQALLQTRRVKLPSKHPEAEAMARELKDFEIRVDQNSNDTYGAFKVGAHDDLATALGLAVLEDPYDYRVQTLPYSIF
jgi:hypothetical protein